MIEEFERFESESSASKSCSEVNLNDFDYPDTLLQYKSFEEKSRFFSQIFVESIDKLHETIVDFGSRTNLIFRGTTEAKYALYNSLQRRIIPTKNYYSVPYRRLLDSLLKNLKMVQDGVIQRFFKFRGIENVTDLSLLSFLQHHNCATPLIDWTYKYEKALYFASHKASWQHSKQEIENYISVYLIHTEIANELNPIKDIQEFFLAIAESKVYDQDSIKEEIKRFVPEENLIEVTEEVIRQLKERARQRYFKKRIHKLLDIDLLTSKYLSFISDKESAPELLLHLYNNLNIISQDGAFFLNSHPFAPLEWVIEKTIVDDNVDYNNVYSVNIHKNLLPTISNILEKGNHNEAAIFPNPYQISLAVQNLSLLSE
jgi:hypothetical protein